jgi:hypothetical protein
MQTDSKVGAPLNREPEWDSLASGDGTGLYLYGLIRPGWLAVGFYVRRPDGLSLADLTVCPDTRPRRSAEDPAIVDPDEFGNRHSEVDLSAMSRVRWLTEYEYLKGPRRINSAVQATSGTLHAALLREVPLGAMQRAAEQAARQLAALGKMLREVGDPAGEYLAALEHTHKPLTPAQLGYLLAAWRFTQLGPGEAKPVIVTARALGLVDRGGGRGDVKYAEARAARVCSDRLSQARKLGWLHSPGKGRSGGTALTPLGQALVESYREKFQEMP